MRAAVECGRLVGQGLLDVAECADTLTAAAIAQAPGRDAAGLRARLMHRLLDAARAEAQARACAIGSVTAALRAGLRADAPSGVLRRAALAANRGVLARQEVDAIAGREVGRVLAARGVPQPRGH